MLLAALTSALLVVPTFGDLVPDAIDALLAAPDDPVFFGLPPALDAEALLLVEEATRGRCVVALGDVTGDAVPDVALGRAPGAGGDTLQVRDGATGAIVWSARPGGGGFRSLRGLAFGAGGRLIAGTTSPRGNVESRDATTGAVLWARALPAGDGDELAHVSSVELVEDVDGDELADVLVAAGQRIDAVLLLSGVDGSTLWKHVAGDVAYDARAVHDLDGDGTPDVAVAGGDDTPFARLLSGASGTPLWDVPLDGPGSVVTAADDIDGDGVPDVFVGQFAEPGACVLALSGADGTRIWESVSSSRNVTALVGTVDTLDLGVRDVLVGSFDNAVSLALGSNGVLLWRREVSTNNTGAMLSVATVGDLDGNGTRDVLSISQDHRVYVMGGLDGQLMALWDTGDRGAAVAALGDGNGDGRSELVSVGRRGLVVLDGEAGLAGGPVVNATPPSGPQEETFLEVWAYPGTGLLIMGSFGTAEIPVPAFGGIFGLSPATLFVVFSGTAPGAGVSGFVMDPMPQSLVGLRIHFQVASILEPGKGLLSDVSSFTITY